MLINIYQAKARIHYNAKIFVINTISTKLHIESPLVDRMRP